jgi:putative phosphoribosyl transferase
LAYRGGRPVRDLAGRTVIVVDDGVAMGATARAAARAARQLGAARVVLAAPVIAAASLPELRSEFEAIVAVEQPDVFFAVGQWYDRFEQVSDEDVIECLHRAGAPDGARELERIEPIRDPPEERLSIPFDDARFGPGDLDADLVLPDDATGLVLFVHGNGSTRQSPQNRFVARAVQGVGLGTLLLDLLTPDEAAEDALSAQLRFDLRLLTARILAAVRSISADPRTRALRLGLFGVSTGAAAALAAAAAMPDRFAAVVARGGRPDLVDPEILRKVRAPVRLVVGARDEAVLCFNRAAASLLRTAELAVVPGAGQQFEEPGALGTVAALAIEWFGRHLAERAAMGAPPAPEQIVREIAL